MANQGLALKVDGLSSPPANTPVVPGRILYKDSFTGDTASVIGRQTDASVAAQRATWVGTENGFATASGKLVKGSLAATSSALLATTAAAVAVTIKLNKRPTTSGFYLDVLRGTVTGAPPSYRLEITDATCRLMKRFAGAHTYLSGSVSIKPGDVISVRCIEGEVTLVVNGLVLASVMDSDVTSGNYAGIASTGTVAGFEIDWLQVETF
ncbi:hypothetical protein AA310_00215 [Arthrobacter sp. YC-RL1]|uniref:hypothetical protein n=1 Tax=Arthrobacter sp. YC-RL1 TaxID=1652545 RepID=UPI00063DD880|nr:hypothetical protein [Arthrobacter sp. YC-RL1]ALQ32153.1 hypothetical protein ATC04_17525 [Arthrobacter sp. YC-RL1]ALQ32200.1 hypothetical protein ATC04_17765 [Arthrobacter sp. YC-RL1]KLI90587.1 hypothetical protein AA310_00215 [Arthrobacter sp. YC-RL1]